MRLTLIAFLAIALHASQASPLHSPPDLSAAVDAMHNPRYRHVLEAMYPGVDGSKQRARIINGQPAALGQFPYQVLNYMTVDRNSWYTCGGSLIRRDWVLTAGHCVYQYSYIELYFGIIERAGSDYSWATGISDLSAVHLHELYDDPTISYDVAVIYLAAAPSDLLQYPNIGLVDLPVAGDHDIDLTGRTATVSGFGVAVDGQPVSDILLYTTAPVMSNSQCALTFGHYIRDSNLCIDTRGAGSSCGGDSGGPLTVEFYGGRRAQAGIVSFGAAAGCSLGYPAVYARVTYFLDWINHRVAV